MWPFSETNAAAMRTPKPAGLCRRVFVDGTFALLGSFSTGKIIARSGNVMVP
jgi:hypothetical protein